MKREIVKTSDGSSTIFVPELNEHYHSVHGAVQESRHVFITHGLALVSSPVRILEIGFGTGLNALLSADYSRCHGTEVYYEGIELHPVEEELWKNLNYHSGNKDLENLFHKIHRAKWEEDVVMESGFILRKTKADFLTCNITSTFNLIYFDAFGFRAQEEMWQVPLFQKLFACLESGGILTTYASKGLIRRALAEAGFLVEKHPGPPGKREMVTAKKS